MEIVHNHSHPVLNWLQDVEQIAKVLLSESCKSNEFIRNTAEDALLSMSENVTPQRAMVALIQEGARFVKSYITKCRMNLQKNHK